MRIISHPFLFAGLFLLGLSTAYDQRPELSFPGCSWTRYEKLSGSTVCFLDTGFFLSFLHIYARLVIVSLVAVVSSKDVQNLNTAIRGMNSTSNESKCQFNGPEKSTSHA
jgi:hypothetical protein